MDYDTVIARIKALYNPDNIAGMARFGINPVGSYGVPVGELRSMAKTVGKNHQLALRLWDSGIRDARILASLVEVPRDVTEAQMEAWVAALNSWDVCDAVCINVFRRTPFAQAKALDWAKREEEFVRRAGFALMATLAVHAKKEPDAFFLAFFPAILQGATDERNFVKKAVNWALRQIGKRNGALNAAAVELAVKLTATNSRTARWVGRDALRELTRKDTVWAVKFVAGKSAE